MAPSPHWNARYRARIACAFIRWRTSYPAGDEQQIVYEVTGKVVPTGGIPLDVGAVVSNVTTLAQIADALDGKPVTERLVTVAGDVENPHYVQGAARYARSAR